MAALTSRFLSYVGHIFLVSSLLFSRFGHLCVRSPFFVFIACMLIMSLSSTAYLRQSLYHQRSFDVVNNYFNQAVPTQIQIGATGSDSDIASVYQRFISIFPRREFIPVIIFVFNAKPYSPSSHSISSSSSSSSSSLSSSDYSINDLNVLTVDHVLELRRFIDFIVNFSVNVTDDASATRSVTFQQICARRYVTGSQSVPGSFVSPPNLPIHADSDAGSDAQSQNPCAVVSSLSLLSSTSLDQIYAAHSNQTSTPSADTLLNDALSPVIVPLNYVVGGFQFKTTTSTADNASSLTQFYGEEFILLLSADALTLPLYEWTIAVIDRLQKWNEEPGYTSSSEDFNFRFLSVSQSNMIDVQIDGSALSPAYFYIGLPLLAIVCALSYCHRAQASNNKKEAKGDNGDNERIVNKAMNDDNVANSANGPWLSQKLPHTLLSSFVLFFSSFAVCVCCTLTLFPFPIIFVPLIANKAGVLTVTLLFSVFLHSMIVHRYILLLTGAMPLTVTKADYDSGTSVIHNTLPTLNDAEIINPTSASLQLASLNDESYILLLFICLCRDHFRPIIATLFTVVASLLGFMMTSTVVVDFNFWLYIGAECVVLAPVTIAVTMSVCVFHARMFIGGERRCRRTDEVRQRELQNRVDVNVVKEHVDPTLTASPLTVHRPHPSLLALAVSSPSSSTSAVNSELSFLSHSPSPYHVSFLRSLSSSPLQSLPTSSLSSSSSLSSPSFSSSSTSSSSSSSSSFSITSPTSPVYSSQLLTSTSKSVFSLMITRLIVLIQHPIFICVTLLITLSLFVSSLFILFTIPSPVADSPNSAALFEASGIPPDVALTTSVILRKFPLIVGKQCTVVIDADANGDDDEQSVNKVRFEEVRVQEMLENVPDFVFAAQPRISPLMSSFWFPSFLTFVRTVHANELVDSDGALLTNLSTSLGYAPESRFYTFLYEYLNTDGGAAAANNQLLLHADNGTIRAMSMTAQYSSILPLPLNFMPCLLLSESISAAIIIDDNKQKSLSTATSSSAPLSSFSMLNMYAASFDYRTSVFSRWSSWLNVIASKTFIAFYIFVKAMAVQTLMNKEQQQQQQQQQSQGVSQLHQQKQDHRVIKYMHICAATTIIFQSFLSTLVMRALCIVIPGQGQNPNASDSARRVFEMLSSISSVQFLTELINPSGLFPHSLSPSVRLSRSFLMIGPPTLVCTCSSLAVAVGWICAARAGIDSAIVSTPVVLVVETTLSCFCALCMLPVTMHIVIMCMTRDRNRKKSIKERSSQNNTMRNVTKAKRSGDEQASVDAQDNVVNNTIKCEVVVHVVHQNMEVSASDEDEIVNFNRNSIEVGMIEQNPSG